jgi:hypothetical protein
MPIEAQTALALLQQGAEYVARNPVQTKTTVKRWLGLLQNKKPRVLVTGNKSAGKTILADFLSGIAYKKGYAPPGVSTKVETSKVPGNPTFMLETIPGDRSIKRSSALHKLGAGKTKVDGVLHVIANGYLLPRGELARNAALARYPTLAELVRANRMDEAEDLRATLHDLRSYWVAKRKPFWVIIALTKADLYDDEGRVDAVRRLQSGGDLFNPLREFQDQVGALNVDIHVAVTACWPDPFVWGKERLDSSYDRARMEHHVELIRRQLCDLVA